MPVYSRFSTAISVLDALLVVTTEIQRARGVWQLSAALVHNGTLRTATNPSELERS